MAAQERGRRSARDYEQALRRQELAAARALTQAVPEGQEPTPRDLAQAHRAFDRALAGLRRLRKDLDAEILRLRGGPGQRARPARPDPLIPYEAAADAIDEVLARWERRSQQLATASERRRRSSRRPA